MNINNVRKVVGKIKNTLFKNSNSYAVGMLKSHFKGSGLQFKDHQVYVPGDDVRFIDWKILAKTNMPYIKTFDEERNVEIVVVLDLSKGMFMGYNGISKAQMAIELTCLLYLLAGESKDHVHVLLILDEITYVPKRSGDAGITFLIAELERKGVIDSKGQVNNGYIHSKDLGDREKFASIFKYVGKKKEVVILSDFHDFLSTDLLKKLLFQKKVHCFRLLSPIDEKCKVPFTIFGSDRYNYSSKINTKIESVGNNLFEDSFSKKIIKLHADGRYLEDFIKEMI